MRPAIGLATFQILSAAIHSLSLTCLDLNIGPCPVNDSRVDEVSGPPLLLRDHRCPLTHFVRDRSFRFSFIPDLPTPKHWLASRRKDRFLARLSMAKSHRASGFGRSPGSPYSRSKCSNTWRSPRPSHIVFSREKQRPTTDSSSLSWYSRLNLGMRCNALLSFANSS